jgi:3-polyprenyl-4-hydroxybenzoate decarboxylase
LIEALRYEGPFGDPDTSDYYTFKMNFLEISGLALPAEGHNRLREHRKTYPCQAYKIMHGFWGMGQIIPRLLDQMPRGGGRRLGRAMNSQPTPPPLIRIPL